MGFIEIEKVHERLFAALAGEIPFSSAIDSIVNTFGAAAGVIFEVDRKSGQFVNWIGSGVEDGEREYMDHMNAINPRMRYALRHSARQVMYEDMFIDGTRMDRSEFYDWLGRQDLRYFLGARVYDEGDTMLFHSVDFTPAHGHPEKNKIDAFKRTMPAVGNAWKVYKNLGPTDEGEDVFGWTPDHLPWAIFSLRSDGTVASMNRSARELLDDGTTICIDNGLVTALDRTSVEQLKRAVQLGIAGHAADALLQSADPHPSLIAQITPVNPMRLPSQTSVVAVMYIWNPLRRSKRFGDVLQRLYGFTGAETRLAEVLSTGVELSMAAEQLGISRNTARNHMQSMFAKTGTRRQNEFLIRIWGVLDLRSSRTSK